MGNPFPSFSKITLQPQGLASKLGEFNQSSPRDLPDSTPFVTTTMKLVEGTKDNITLVFDPSMFDPKTSKAQGITLELEAQDTIDLRIPSGQAVTPTAKDPNNPINVLIILMGRKIRMVI